MNAHDLQSMPGLNPSYLPYFYQSGQFSHYVLPRKPDADIGLPDTPSQSQFSSTARYFGPDRMPQTVEQIIRSGYFAVPSGEPETALISDKHHTARLGLDDMIGQIRSRYELFEQNLYDIECSKCAALNAVFVREAEMGKPSDSRQTYSLSKVMQTLYKQEREERLLLWQDISKLKLALPELAQSYLSAYRKQSILNSQEDDSR